MRVENENLTAETFENENSEPKMFKNDYWKWNFQ